LKLVIDTSVVVKWFVEEDGFEMARSLIEPELERIGPELVIAETANVLQRKVRTGELKDVQAMEAVKNLPYFFDRLVPSVDLVEHGFALSQSLDHSVYDCMYLALALADDEGRLVTSDMKFISKAKAAGFGDRIWDLNVATNAVATGQGNKDG
jgi:predicted nucleic acid-binding protein